MSNNVQSLWPTQIRPRILSPLTILKAQAAALAEQTEGVLLAEIRPKEIEDQKVALTFDIVVPALDGYRHRILSVKYSRDLPYPAEVDAEVFRAQKNQLQAQASIQALLTALSSKEVEKIVPINRANGDQELTALIEKVFKSPQVLSAAQSLIIRATEALDEAQPASSLQPESSLATNVDEHSEENTSVVDGLSITSESDSTQT